MSDVRGKYCILGVGTTAFGKLPGRSTLSLNAEASAAAIADAGLQKQEIDAVLCKYPTSGFESLYSLKLAQRLGITPEVTGVLDQAGASNISLIGYAIWSIEAGQCSAALISFADNPRTGSRHAYAQPRGTGGVYGWIGTPSSYAMIAARYIHQYAVPPEALGEVAVACRRHGAMNPNAHLRAELSLEQYLQTPYLIAPLRRDDCALVSDGGAAIVVTSVERARALGVQEPIRILGFGQAHVLPDLEARPDLTVSAAGRSASHAFRMAGISPSEVDLAQLYDCFTITVLMTLEEYGFCDPGEAKEFVRGGALQLGGRLPTNTAGGLLSETGMPGMQLIVEAVRQLRGEAGPRQVDGARTAVVSNQGGTMTTHSTLVLQR